MRANVRYATSRNLDRPYRRELRIGQTDRNRFLDGELPGCTGFTDLTRYTAAAAPSRRWTDYRDRSSNCRVIGAYVYPRPRDDEAAPWRTVLGVSTSAGGTFDSQTCAMPLLAKPWRCGTRRQPSSRHPARENEANVSYSSYMRKTNEPCKVPSITRPHGRWEEWRGGEARHHFPVSPSTFFSRDASVNSHFYHRRGK